MDLNTDDSKSQRQLTTDKNASMVAWDGIGQFREVKLMRSKHCFWSLTHFEKLNYSSIVLPTFAEFCCSLCTKAAF